MLSSPAGLASSTADTTHITSDCHVAVTAGKNIAIASGAGFFASVRQAIRLFVEKAGFKLIAAAGDIEMQALANGIKLLAKLEITQQANRITLTAHEEIVINGGGSYVKLSSGSVEMGTNGAFTVHAASHSLTLPKTLQIQKSALGKLLVNDDQTKDYEHFFMFKDEHGKPIDWLEYRIDIDGNKVSEGLLDDAGRTPAFDLEREIVGTFWIKRDKNGE